MKFVLLLSFAVAAMALDNPALQAFTTGNHQFTASFHQEVVKQNPGNLIASPISAETVLALTYLGAKGKTAEELSTSLKLPATPEETKEAFRVLIPQLQKNEYVTLSSANRLYVKDGFKIKPEYQQLATEVFQAGVETVDFAETLKTSKNINQWVEGKTNNKIKDLINPDQLSSLTRLVLVNALYFQGNWTNRFDEFATQHRDFFKSATDVVKVPTMHTTATFAYAENTALNAKFVVLPYEGGEVSLTIVLPNEKEGLAALEARLPEVLQPQNLTQQRVSLFMPKFKIESELKLVPVLKKLGVTTIFDEDHSDLSGIANVEPDRLYVSDVIQKAFINVTETGTEAAAATAVIINLSKSSVVFSEDPIEVKVERPFLFHITSKDVVLFSGRVSNL